MRTKDWIETEGTISNVMLESTGGRNGDFYPVTFCYRVDGHYYSGEFVTGSSSSYKEGGKVKLRYNPANPEENDLDGVGDSQVWIGRLITVLGSLGLVYLICIRGCRTH